MLKHALVLGCAVICAILAGASVIYFDSLLRRSEVEPVAPVSYVAVAPSSSASQARAHGIAIPKAKDGHFWLEASINQKAVRFLVDTGASTVALTLADAQRLGFDVNNLNYNRDVITAAGQVKAAQVTLGSVFVGSSRIDNVEALIIKEGLENSLLGMSYLGRLERIEATRSSLILHP